jgi:diaminopimelate epimerase
MTPTYPSSSRVSPFLRNYAQKKTPEIDIHSITRSVLLDGTEQVISHEGTSQYNRDGSGAAACGLAALNFARVVFLKEQDGLRDATLLQAVLSRECAEVRQHCPLRLSA